MDTLKRTLAAICAILFVLTALVALLLFNLERRALTSSTYKQALTDLGIYQRLPSLIGEMVAASSAYDPCLTNIVACRADDRSPEAIACFEAALGARQYQDLISGRRTPTAEQTQLAEDCLTRFPPPAVEEGDGPPPFVKNLSAQDWQHIIETLLPPAELNAMVDQGMDSFFAVVNGRADSAYLDMTPFKRRLTGPAGVEAVMALLRAQPPCTLEQIAQMTLSALSLDGELVLCSPSDELGLIVQPLIEFNLQLAAFGIPDQWPLIPESMNLAGDDTPIQRLRTFRLILRLSPLVPLLFLLGLTALAVRTAIDWLRWWGWPFLVTGIAGVLMGFLSAPVLTLVLSAILTRRLPAYVPVGIVELGTEITGAVVRQMLRPLAWQSLALSVIAAAMLASAAYMQRQRLAKSEADTLVFDERPPAAP